MSVLNQSGEEQVECPLCMEPLEVDDLNFYPCTCGYQICRFCWHRIRTDENGLCPACRKAYSEDPADFIPLSKEQVAKLKADKRHRDQQRKAKLSENRKHLASVRVVQRNLVFVVGLPVRLADPELLKKHEYFGKFGKIHKVVINQSTSYAGSQGPSASAYVTYMKSDDALRAIQSVNNIVIDGRLIKSSLGTTKYCSHFMKNQPCPKSDCMYLHDFDPEASFTKEQMHAGKHQEYEKKLHDALLSRQNITPPPGSTSSTNATEKGSANAPTPPASQQQEVGAKKDGTGGAATGTVVGASKGKEGTQSLNGISTNKDNWPQLNLDKSEKPDSKRTDPCKDKSSKSNNKSKLKGSQSPPSNLQIIQNSADITTNPTGIYSSNGSVKIEGKVKDRDSCDMDVQNQNSISKSEIEEIICASEQHNQQMQRDNLEKFKNGVEGHTIFGLGDSKLRHSSDNTSFFSQGFQTVSNSLNGASSTQNEHLEDHTARENDLATPTGVLTDNFPSINTSEDWAAAFGFANHSDHLEELAKQATRGRQGNMTPKDTLETLVNGIGGSPGLAGNYHGVAPSQNGPSGVLGGFGSGKLLESGFESPRRYFESGKLQENILDALSTNKSNGYVGGQHFGGLVNKEPLNRGSNGINGLDQNMSKFFMDFHKSQTQLNMLNGINSLLSPPTQPHQQQNGFYQPMQERLLLLQQQKQLEEQLLNLNLKQQQQNYQFQNGYINGANTGPFGARHLYMPGQSQGQGAGIPQITPTSAVLGGQSDVRQSAEDELDFDPFQETQKGLAELIATEKNHTQGRSSLTQSGHINGLVHSQSSGGVGHLPPPPPGFIQQNSSTHMNSFGSKILPFLNMSNSQQSLNSPSQNSWPNNYINQQKNITTNMNDWKNLDPAILSSSRHYQLANNISNPSVREHSAYQNLAQPINNLTGNLSNLSNSQTSPTTQSASPQMRPHSYMNGTTDFNTSNLFSNFAQQIQPNMNGFSQLNQPSWFASEGYSNSNITSPPGFRNSQSKQQEC
ncbi:hypothetical protein HHI36_021336 [Cryptolaemus montrouzieri]